MLTKKDLRIGGFLVFCDNCDNPADWQWSVLAGWVGCAPCITGKSADFNDMALIVSDKRCIDKFLKELNEAKKRGGQMIEIPKAVCGCCMAPMRPKKNGVVLQALNEGRPYYKIAADEWECRNCGNSVYIGFGRKPVLVKHEVDYELLETDGSFELKD